MLQFQYAALLIGGPYSLVWREPGFRILREPTIAMPTGSTLSDASGRVKPCAMGRIPHSARLPSLYPASGGNAVWTSQSFWIAAQSAEIEPRK